MSINNIIDFNQYFFNEELDWAKTDITECLLFIEKLLQKKEAINEQTNIDLAAEFLKEYKESKRIQYIIYKRDLEFANIDLIIIDYRHIISIDNLLVTGYNLPYNMPLIKSKTEKMKIGTKLNKLIVQNLIDTTIIKTKIKNLQSKIKNLNIKEELEEEKPNNILIFKPLNK